MLEEPTRAQHLPWSINGKTNKRDTELSSSGPITNNVQAGGLKSETISGTDPAAQGKVNAASGDHQEQPRGRSAFSWLHRQAVGISPATAKASEQVDSGKNGIVPLVGEQEWRRSLEADLDPIYKESGRSRSRDQSQPLHRTPSAFASSASAIAEGRGHEEARQPVSVPGAAAFPLLSGALDNASLLESSPSSNSSFPHTTTTSATTASLDLGSAVGNDSPVRLSSSSAALPIKGGKKSLQIWDFEGSPSHRSDWGSMHSTDGSLNETKRSARSSIPDWTFATRRSLSSTGMSGDRDSLAGRMPTFQRALSINTDAQHLGQNAGAQQTFSPGSMRSISPEGGTSAGTFHNGNVTSSSPRHGLGRLPEGEEAADELFASKAFANPPQHSLGARHRSTSSAAALQGGMHRDRMYVGRPTFDSSLRSGSVWGNTPLGTDFMSGSPTSFSYTQAQSFVRPSSASRFSSDFMQSPSEQEQHRGRQRQSELNARYTDEKGSVEDLSGEMTLPSSLRTETFGLPIDDIVAPSGTESRRHSTASSVPLSGQRRAIGFEVTKPVGSVSRTTSVGRFGNVNASGERMAPGSGGSGYGLFGGGSLAISDDDLAADFDSLAVNSHRASMQRQRSETIDGVQAPFANNASVATSAAAAAAAAAAFGGQAASMPPGFTGFGSSSKDHRLGDWPLSARLRDEENASIWSGESVPSPSGHRGDGGARTSGVSGGAVGLSARAQSFQVNQNPSALHGSGGVPTSTFEPFGISTQPSLSDHAIASLVTLGPLAPTSGGGGGGGGHHSSESGGGGSHLHDLGKGVPLQMLPRDTRLFIVEFKQGRTDLYFRQSPAGSTQSAHDDVRKGDLVIVEADRGKDLGSVINDSITVDQVQTFLAQQAELAQLSAAGARPDGIHPAAITLGRLTRSVNPKRLFAKAGPSDTSLLHAKAQDEERALTLCSTKVNQRGLPMTVVAAEMQWDRRKLTFYYTATQRVDFRDLVKELFRLYKTRIWMCHLSHPSNAAGANTATSATT